MGDKTPLKPSVGIQTRFALALASLVVLSMSMLGVSVFLNQRDLLKERMDKDVQEMTRVLQEKGESSSTFLARIAPQGLLTYDFLLLEGYVEELSADEDIVFAVILNTSGAPITHYLNPKDPYFAQHHLQINPQNYDKALAEVRADANLIIVRRPINYEGAVLGSVEIGLSRARINDRAQELRATIRRDLQRVTFITAVTIIVSLFLLILLIEWTFRLLVVRPLHSLSAQMARVQGGDLSARAPVTRHDEIGHLAANFNRMTEDLQNQLLEIEAQRRVYKETRDYLASVLNNSADMIATTALDGTLVEFNPSAERILGYARKEVAGQSANRLFNDQHERERLYAAVGSGETTLCTETRLVRKDHALIDVELTMSPLRNTVGDLIGAVFIGRDITQAKMLRRDLIQAEKLASVGQVAGWIAHQIRNMLGQLLMNAASLRPEAPTNVKAQAHRDLTEAIEAMDTLVTDLLDYSKTLKLHTTRIDLNAALADMLKTVPAAPLQISITTDFADNLELVSVDVFKFEHAVGNLLKNALQAMPPGGLLHIGTRNGPAQGEVTITIEDNGVGIPARNVEKIFQPFFTTKPGGTGLGLALCARIVEAHGGYIRAANVLPTGARFTLVLPTGAP